MSGTTASGHDCAPPGRIDIDPRTDLGPDHAKLRKDAGIGTIIAIMLPYTLIVLVTWLLFFVGWYLLGIPLGPGYPAKL